MKTRKLALALLPVARGRFITRRVEVLDVLEPLSATICAECDARGKIRVQHVLPFSRVASVGPRLLARLREKRAALSPRVTVPGSPAALETVAQAAREALSA